MQSSSSNNRTTGKQSSYKQVLVFLCMVLVLNVSAQDAAFAYQMVQQGNYRAAVEDYQKLISVDAKGHKLYHNLAASYLKLGRPDSAILYAVKALRWSPNEETTKTILAEAREMAGIVYVELPQSNLMKNFWYIINSLQSRVWFWISVFLLLVAVLLLKFAQSPSQVRIKSSYILALIATGFILLLFTWVRHQHDYNTDEFIVMKPTKAFRSADENSDSIKTLKSGEKVTKSDQIGPWIKTILDDGTPVWLRQNDLIQIKL